MNKTHDNEDLIDGQQYFTVDIIDGLAGRTIGDIDQFYYCSTNDNKNYTVKWFKHFGAATRFSRQIKKENADLIFKKVIIQQHEEIYKTH